MQVTQKGYVLGTFSKVVVVGLSQVNPRSLPQDWTPAPPEERHSGSAQDVGIRMEPITHCSSSAAAPFHRLQLIRHPQNFQNHSRLDDSDVLKTVYTITFQIPRANKLNRKSA